MYSEINLNALYKNALYYSQSADIISTEISKKLTCKSYTNFIKEDIGLFMPLVTLTSFSCELFLKLILLINSNDINLKGHNLAFLYNKIPMEMQNDIVQILLEKNPNFNIVEFQKYLNEISSLFIDSRYIHEKCELSISYEFLKEFRYALIDICNNLMRNKNKI